MALQEFSLNNEDLALTSIFDSATLLESAKDLAQSQLQGFAQSQDFNDRIASAFGEGRDVNKLRDIWLTGKIYFPAIEVRSKSELGGAYGAFSQETGKIYLAQELINTNSKALISSVLLEEYGHFVDSQVNVGDSAGDEGEIFSGIVQGKVFEAEQMQQLKAKDDHATITLDSQVLQVEQAIFPLREGGKEGKTETITLDAKGPGAAQIFYQMFGVPDRLQLRYEGKVIFDSGFTSGSKTTRFNIPAGNSNKLDVVLTANPSISSTRWQYKIDTTTARDPLPLQVSLVSGTRDEKNGKRIAEGIVYIGRQGFFPMLKVEGRVEYDDKTISVDGIVSSLIGSSKVKATPLFKSKFNIDVKTATGSLQEDSSFGNQFKLGGLVDIDFSSLSLKPSGLTFGAKFNLGKVGNAGLPDFFFGGSNTLSISQNDAKFGASVKLSLPNFKAEDYEKVNKKLFEFLPLKEFSDISVEYVGSEDKIKIQGKVVIAPFVKLVQAGRSNKT